jgi:HSP20 family protein
LFNRFFGFGRRGIFDMNEMFRGFDDVHREMNSILNVFNDLASDAPKDLVREYQTSDGAKVREVGPIVYGYSMTIGPDGKPHVREFGNIKAGKNISGHNLDIQKPYVTAERDPISDVTSTDKEIKIVVEIPGLQEEDIKINAYDNGKVEIKTSNQSPRKYYISK